MSAAGAPLSLFSVFGIELEYMTVRADTGAVLPVADHLLRADSGVWESHSERGELGWSNELALHVIELKTKVPVPSLTGVAESAARDVQSLNQALAALGGVWLSMEQTGNFNAGMTQGRGFIGLAAMIVGRWTPLGAFGAALLFASVTGLSQSLTISHPTGDLGNLINGVPGEFWEALPYIITIVVLAGLIGRSIAPAADGQPYERESAS